MFDNFGYEVSIILKQAERERYHLCHPYVGTEHLLLSLLASQNEVSLLLREYDLTYDIFRDELIETVGKASKPQSLNLYTPMLRDVLELSFLEAKENNKGVITPSLLFRSMLDSGEGIAYHILLQLDFPFDEVYNKLKRASISKDSSKKSLEVMKIGVRLNDSVSKNERVVGRDKEMDLLIETLLRRQKNNPLLIGKAGVGKTALVEEFVRRIKANQVPSELCNMQVIMLEMGALVSGTKYRGEFEERLHKIIREVIREQDIILFIDEIHTMVNAGGAEGAIAAADILKPYLARGDIKIIGATTLEEYHEFLECDKALDRRFEKIMIEEPNKEDMLEILKAVRPSIKRHYKVSLTDENLVDFYELSEEYLFHKCNPDKTIELIDSVCARLKLRKEFSKKSDLELDKVRRKKERCVKHGDFDEAMKAANLETKLRNQIQDMETPSIAISRDDILEVIECKTHAKIRGSYKELMQKLRQNLFQTIFGQEKALNDILDVMSTPHRKGTSFLLVGGSGVGKTETVKTISETLKTHLLRIDMSEYASIESMNKLIGTPAGYVGYKDTYVLEVLRDQPFTTVLFDEIEKAHPQVLNLLLQILDEGFITDAKGNKIRFDHTCIFLTSNVLGKKRVGFETSNKTSFDGFLSKELVGRIDKVVEYIPITEDIAREYICKELLNKDVTVDDILKDADITRYGLRNVRNLVQKYNKQMEFSNIIV